MGTGFKPGPRFLFTPTEHGDSLTLQRCAVFESHDFHFRGTKPTLFLSCLVWVDQLVERRLLNRKIWGSNLRQDTFGASLVAEV
jgi:hypothetical protein